MPETLADSAMSQERDPVDSRGDWLMAHVPPLIVLGGGEGL